MKTKSLAQWLPTLGAAALLLAGSASAADVHVMISVGFYSVYAELAPAFERVSGHRLVTTRGPSMGDSPESIPARLARGEIADVVILDGDAAEELGKRGMVGAGVTFAGALPAELQPGFSFAGALTNSTRQPEAATALLRFLASPDAAPVIWKAGLAPDSGQ